MQFLQITLILFALQIFQKMFSIFVNLVLSLDSVCGFFLLLFLRISFTIQSIIPERSLYLYFNHQNSFN